MSEQKDRPEQKDFYEKGLREILKEVLTLEYLIRVRGEDISGSSVVSKIKSKIPALKHRMDSPPPAGASIDSPEAKRLDRPDRG